MTITGPVADSVMLTEQHILLSPVDGPVWRCTAGDTEGSSEEAPLLLHDPGSLSMMGDDTQSAPPHTQVTTVPESVMSWLSRNNFRLAKCDGPAQDFADFTATRAPCLFVEGNPGPPSAASEPHESSDSRV